MRPKPTNVACTVRPTRRQHARIPNSATTSDSPMTCSALSSSRSDRKESSQCFPSTGPARAMTTTWKNVSPTRKRWRARHTLSGRDPPDGTSDHRRLRTVLSDGRCRRVVMSRKISKGNARDFEIEESRGWLLPKDLRSGPLAVSCRRRGTSLAACPAGLVQTDFQKTTHHVLYTQGVPATARLRGPEEGVMRDGIFIVDGDGHVMDFAHRCYQKYLPEQYRRRIAFFPGAQWDRRQAPNGDLGRDPNTPQEMMADMAQEGIDLAFLYPTSALRIGEIREADYQAALCRAYNDFMADWCKAAPDRLKGVAIVPYLDPTEAARELDRAVSRLGLVGLMFPTFIPGRNVADPFFWPIYAEAERLGVPVGMHASGSETGDPYRFSNFLAVHTWTHAPEQMISVISCVYGGLFEKFQRLRIGFMESGAGWVPFFMEHMDGEFEKRPWDAPLCKAKPSEYMTCGRAYYSCEPEEKTIPYVTKWVGEDNILYASDYPHWDSEWPHTVDELMKRDDLSR